MQIKIDDKIFEPYLLQSKVEARVAEIAQHINTDYKDRQPVFLGVLSGSFFFMADLVKQTTLDAEISFVKLASYEGERSSGKMEVQLSIHTNLKNRDVIIVEDIVDTGHTLKYLLGSDPQGKTRFGTSLQFALQTGSLSDSIRRATIHRI